MALIMKCSGMSSPHVKEVIAVLNRYDVYLMFTYFLWVSLAYRPGGHFHISLCGTFQPKFLNRI